MPRRTLNRYILIGGSIYIFEILVIIVVEQLGAGPLVAVAWSFWLGLIVSFVLQKIVTFGDKRLHHRILLPQIIIFSLLVLFNFGFTLLVTKILAGVIPVVICRTLALGITTVWNFYLYRTRIFKTSSNSVN